jgi:Family of unknown function (DUF6130)
MKRYRWAVALAALALVGAACTGSSASPSGATTAPSTASGPRPSTDAVLTIVSPTNGEVVKGTDVPLEVRLKGGKIVSVAGSTALVPNEGHLHVYLDDQLISMTATTSTTIPNVQPGSHLLKVEFVANDHFPYDPRVIQVVSFEVKPS